MTAIRDRESSTASRLIPDRGARSYWNSHPFEDAGATLFIQNFTALTDSTKQCCALHIRLETISENNLPLYQ